MVHSNRTRLVVVMGDGRGRTEYQLNTSEREVHMSRDILEVWIFIAEKTKEN